MNAFEKHWRMFVALKCATLDAGELDAARAVFYAGGASLFLYLTNFVGGLERGDACRAMDALQREFAEFGVSEGEHAGPPTSHH